MSDHYVGLLSLILAIFATFVSICYFLRPLIIFGTYKRTKNDKTKWVTEVKNRNWLPLAIKEIKCEMAISKAISFSEAKTLKLLKSETLFLHKDNKYKPSNYIFVPEEKIYNYEDYKFLRTRLLVSNLLGIKKHYERLYKVNELVEESGKILYSNCKHKSLTKKLYGNKQQSKHYA